ncbi:MAG: exo-alpha-sialidase [Sedimentisphaeraceae bacterium JB056]
MKIFNTIFLVCVCSVCFAGKVDDCHRIKPLANDCKVLYKVEDPVNSCIYDPAIAVCPNGRIIGSFSVGGGGASKIAEVKNGGPGFIYTSDDDGENWVYRKNFDLIHFRPFVAGDKLYMIGHRGNLGILSSDDWGSTWSKKVNLTDKQVWHGSATNVWYKDNYVYLVMEREAKGDMKGGWKVAELIPVLMRGDMTKDLTKRESWTFASEMPFYKAVNDKELEWLGVPFYPSFYPDMYRTKRTYIRKNGTVGNIVSWPCGWLEANVVQILDPKHYWYDSTGHTFHIFMRFNSGISNIGCVMKAVEQKDGSIKTEFVTAPSGKKHFFVPLPGGQMKFSVVYDEKTKLYWMAGTQTTDSMTKAELLDKDRFDLPYNERRRLVLHFSKNMIDWCFAGVISIGPSEKSARHYPQMVIKDDALLVMSRSGDLDSNDAHNGNIATFHKIENFRDLVY